MEQSITVKQYLSITRCRRLKFLVHNGVFEEITARAEKWGEASWPVTLDKWLDKEVFLSFIDSKGVVTIHTKQ